MFTSCYADDTEVNRPSPTSQIGDYHLQSPIRPDSRYYLGRSLGCTKENSQFINRYDRSFYRLPPFVRELSKTLKSKCPEIVRNNSSVVLDSEKLYGKILSTAYSDKIQILNWVNKYIDVANSSVMDVILDYDSNSRTEFKTDLKVSDIFKRCSSIKTIWEDIKESMLKLSKSRSNEWKSMKFLGPSNIDILYSRTYLIYPDENNVGTITGNIDPRVDKFYIFDYEQVMMISDTISSRCLVIMYLDISNEEISYLPSASEVINMYKIYDEAISVLGNDAYKEIKEFESLCYSTIMEKSDRTELYKQYKESIVKEAKKEGHEFSLSMLDKLIKTSCSVICEIHGLYRHWGHPTVDESKGCDKIRKIAHNRPPCDVQVLRDIEGCIKRQFCLSFLVKHNRWPKCDTSKLTTTSILRVCIENQSRCINLCDDNISLKEWAALKVKDELIFDYHVDYTDLIDDKAISLSSKYHHTLFDNSITNNKNKSRSETYRRILCEILRRNNVSVQEACDLVRKGLLPTALYNILLSSKEREVKIDPRMFAMLCLELRLYFCVTEKNISEKLFPYFPQQSMTSGEEQLHKRLYKISNTSDKTGVLVILIGIDFKSWNIHWSYESTCSIFEMIDDLFGIPNLYKCTHDIFRKCDVLLCSRLYPDSSMIFLEEDSVEGKPKLLTKSEIEKREAEGIFNYRADSENKTRWSCHEGGFEGIRQKGWTLITIGILLLVEKTIGLKSSIIGQGDNQVVKLEIPYPTSQYKTKEIYIQACGDEIKQKVSKFVDTLDSIVKSIGLEIKKEETWASDSVMAYGKDIIINGAIMSQSLKRVSRGLPDTNQIYPTLHTKISTLQTAGLSAAQKTYHMYTLYYMSQIETIMLFIKDTERLVVGKQFKSIMDKFQLGFQVTSKQQLFDIMFQSDFYKLILYSSTDVFGLPISGLNDYLYRGHPDSLTGYLSFLEDSTEPMARRIYSWLEERKYELGDGNVELLYMNPSAVNIRCVNPVHSIFKKSMNEYLKTNTNNKNLKEIFNTSMDHIANSIYSYMSECEPQYPRVFHELIQASYISVSTTFLSKFHNSRTLQQIRLTGDNNINFFRLMDDSNSSTVLDLIKKFRSIRCLPTRSKNMCSTVLADDMRNYSWRQALSGKEIEGVTVPHPRHQFEYIEDPDPRSITNTEYISALTTYLLSKNHLELTGKLPPFIGSKTHEKKSGRLMVVPTANRPLQSALRIEQLRSWCFSDAGDINLFLDSLISSRTGLNKEIIELSSGKIFSGSISHRLNDHDGNKSTLNNMRGNITTHILLSTDKMGDFSRGSDNYNIHFQGAIHYLLRRINNSVLHSNTLSFNYARLIMSHKDCLRKYSDDKIVGPSNVPHVPVFSTNPLVYSDLVDDEVYKLPVTDFMKVINHNKSVWAASSHLFSKFSSNIENQVWEKGESHAPIVSSLSLQDIVKLGLEPIIDHLSVYLILYLEIDEINKVEALNNLPKDIWGALPDYCMHPEVYRDLIHTLKLDGISGLHDRSYVITNKLNGYLMYKINTCIKYKDKLFNRIKDIIYFNSTGIPMSTIVRMWSYSNYICNIYGFPVHRNICRIVQNNCRSYMISLDIFYKISRVIIDNPGYGLSYILLNNPIHLSKTPPEAHLRNNIVTDNTSCSSPPISFLQPKREILDLIACHKRLSGRYPHKLSISCNTTSEDTSERVSIMDIAIPKCTTYKMPKTKKDHSYRLVNNISTAYLKYLEIIIREKLPLTHPCICTADGEGSVSYMMHKITGKNVYYNSLCDRSKLTPHRFENYVPGSFLCNPENIVGAHLCMREGGDLTDHRYLRKFLELLPSDISILTMDAETSGAFTPKIALEICKSIQLICSTVRINSVIYKTFTNCKRTLLIQVASLEPYFKSVKVVIPCFSSHEGTECFIVAKDRRLVVPKSFVDLTLVLDKSRDRYSSSIYNFGRDDNDYKKPYQEDRQNITEKLLTYGYALGFKCNFANSLSRYLLDNSIIDHDINLVSLFTRCYRDTLHQISNLLESFHYSSIGKVLSRDCQINMLGKRIIHKPIDRYCLVILNLQIIYKALASYEEGDIIPDIEYILKRGIALHKGMLREWQNASLSDFSHKETVNKRDILYFYRVTDISSWKIEFLKYFWKIHGHITKKNLCIEREVI